MLARPGVQWRQIVLIDQLGQRAAPVVAQVGGLRRDTCHEFWQVRRQVVTAALAEFVEKIRRPIGLVHFQAVAENRVRDVCPAGLDQRIGDGLQMVLNRLHAEVVEDKALRADGCAFHLLPGSAGDEEEHDARTIEAPDRNLHAKSVRHWQQLCVLGVVVLRSASRQKHSQQFFAVANRRQGKGRDAALHWLHDDAQFPCRIRHGHVRSAVRPAATQRQIHAHAEIVRSLRGETNHAEKIFREKR